MANELKHITKGTSLTQAEFEHIDLHACNSQATGDLIYASSATQLSRLEIGAADTVFTCNGTIPAWSATPVLNTAVAKGTWTASGTWTIPAVTLGGTVTGGAQVLSNLGMTYIGDTADANVTLGLVINQGAADNSIFTFKSSDIAHGMTTQAETDTYAKFGKVSATNGGVEFVGLSGASDAFRLMGFVTTDNTIKGTGAVGCVGLYGYKKTGTTVGALGADSNIVYISAGGTTRFIFDNEGSAHAEVEWIAFAEHDDMALVRDMESELLLREDEAKTNRRHLLENLKIIGKDSWRMENGRLRAMVNTTKLAMLHHGALLQLYGKLSALEEENRLLGQQVKMLIGR